MHLQGEAHLLQDHILIPEDYTEWGGGERYSLKSNAQGLKRSRERVLPGTYHIKYIFVQ